MSEPEPAPSSATSDLPVTLVVPVKGWIPIDFGELWAYRELLYFFVWRDLKVRYKQTVLGVAWAILQPVLTMIVFTLLFGRMAGIGSEGYPYPIFSYAALLPRTLFSQGLSRSSNSLVGAQNLLKKVYFPRSLIPTASCIAPLVDFTLAFVVYFALMAYYGIVPSAAIAWLPAFSLQAVVASLGLGLWFSALNVEFRDVRHAMPFFIQLWLFVTPIIYPTSQVIEKLSDLGIPSWIYGLNPMCGVVDGFRWALLGSPLHVDVLAVSAVTTLLVLVFGALWFRRMENRFADIV